MQATGLFMSHSESYKYQIISKYLGGSLYRDEAAQLLQVSERTVTRLSNKVKEKGVFGIKHGNYGKKPNLKYSAELKRQVIELFKKSYFDFNVLHFSEKLEQDHQIKISYQTLWIWLKKEKLVKHPRRKRRKKHVFRPRMPQEGLLLQMDGCHHKFNGKDEWCLISAIDDATSEIPYAEFFNGETTLSCMKVLKKIIEIKGVPKSIYTDRAGWTGGSKRADFSHFQVACEKLGIQLLFANSPEAKGRIERSFRTIQDRLIPELRSSGITSMDEANEYLKSEFLTKYWNDKKIVKPRVDDSAYEPLDPWLNLDEILCLIEDRKIGSDHTASYQGQRYIIKPPVGSLAGLVASFKVNIEGELKVSVMEQEVEIRAVSTRQYKVLDKINSDKKLQLLHPDIDIPMALLISDLWSSVWNHKVTGKPLKLSKRAIRVLGKAS